MLLQNNAMECYILYCAFIKKNKNRSKKIVPNIQNKFYLLSHHVLD